MKKALYLILAGVALGILLAPDKGSETVRKLREKFDDLKDQASDQFDEVVAQGKDLIGKGKSVATDVADNARRTKNEW